MLTRIPQEIAEAGTAARWRAHVAYERVLPTRFDLASWETSNSLHLLISGTAIRYRMLANGNRQITALILPGDVCDLEDHVRGRSATVIATITPCVIGEIPRAALFDDRAIRPEWADIVFRNLARENAIATEWLVSLGRRSAYEATAHLFCEIWARMQAVGGTDDTSFPLELTQVDLADVLGLTPVHVNRTLRDLRKAELIKVRNRRATILDPAGLRAAADFDARYLGRHEAGLRGLYSR